MSPQNDCSLFMRFDNIADPRASNSRHLFTDIIGLSVLSIMCGADGWDEIESYGKAKLDWLKQFFRLPFGIPSNHTFERLFTAINPNEFRNCFLKWIDDLVKTLEGDIIPIDGKTLRRSFAYADKSSAIHMVSAWSANNQIVLGQVKTDKKSNEITAIPNLLKLLDIAGATVTIDAMGTQRKIAKQITDQEGDYVFALKGNQSKLHEDVRTFFESQNLKRSGNFEIDYYKTIDKGVHGRNETRKFWITSNISQVKNHSLWKGLKSIGMVESIRKEKGKITKEIRYFICSISADAQLFAKAVRCHWQIENTLHWTLDIAFQEDDSRIRKGNAPENFAILRHICLNLLKNEKTYKAGIKIKRKKAGWDDQYLFKIFMANSQKSISN